jgi:hypothetical protein
MPVSAEQKSSSEEQLLQEIKCLIRDSSDPHLAEAVAEAEAQLKQAKESLASPIDSGLRDMSETCLDGELGEVCARRMLIGGQFPMSYAWPAMLGAASALVPRTSKTRFNLDVALVGPKHSGKSQAIDRAQRLLGVNSPILLDVMAGSAEALIKKCKDAAGNGRLFSPDELGHLLSKAAIQHASFPYILCRAFYHDRFEVLMGKGQSTIFNASLSIIGGIVEEKFEDLFGPATMAGLYDRFLLSACPDGYGFEYEPFDDSRMEDWSPVSVAIDDDVWLEKAAWRIEEHDLEPRIIEISIRAAAICAAFDGRTRLRACDLGPARELARYQTRIRRLLKPNPGENFEGKVALKILDYLDRHQGRLVSVRTLLREINAYRYGPSVAHRALAVLHANGEIEFQSVGRTKLVRRVLDLERMTKTGAGS